MKSTRIKPFVVIPKIFESVAGRGRVSRFQITRPKHSSPDVAHRVENCGSPKRNSTIRKNERKKIIRRERGAGQKTWRIWTLKSWRIFLYGGIRRRINDCVGKSRLVCGNLFHFATRLAPSPYFRPPFRCSFNFSHRITSFHVLSL